MTPVQKFHSKKYKGFTLVELIVVITILVILGTISFLQLGSFAGSARDSVRLSDIGNIIQGLELVLIKNGSLVAPDASDKGIITLMASGTVIGYQWYAGNNVLRVINMSHTTDPLDKKYYTYSTNANYTKYQVLGLMEESDTLGWIDMAYAGYETRIPIAQGSSLWILLENTGSSNNTPIQELYAVNTFTGVDVVNTQTWYTAVFDKNSMVSGSGIVLKKVEALNILASTNRTYININDIINSSLVGYWDMSTLTGDGKLKDLSGNKNDGTLSGTINTSGKYGNARNFNGITDHIVIPDSDVFYFTGDFSMSVWIYPNRANNSFEWLIHQWETNTNTDVNSLEIWPNNQIRWLIRNTVTSIIDFYSPVNSVSLNTWQHIVVKREWNVFSMFINGVLVNSQTSALALSNTPYDLWIGARNAWWTSPKYSQWNIDEVRMYKRALSDSEIQSLYNATK